MASTDRCKVKGLTVRRIIKHELFESAISNLDGDCRLAILESKRTMEKWIFINSKLFVLLFIQSSVSGFIGDDDYHCLFVWENIGKK